MLTADAWHRHDGKNRPRTGARKILVRLRCQSRNDVEQRDEVQLASYWKRWSHDGGAGDIIEWRYA